MAKGAVVANSESDSDTAYSDTDIFDELRELAAIDEENASNNNTDSDDESADAAQSFKDANGDDLPSSFSNLTVKEPGLAYESLESATKESDKTYKTFAVVTCDVGSDDDGPKRLQVFRAYHVISEDETETYYLITDQDTAYDISKQLTNGKGYFPKKKAEKIVEGTLTGIDCAKLIMDTPTAEAVLAAANKKRKRKPADESASDQKQSKLAPSSSSKSSASQQNDPPSPSSSQPKLKVAGAMNKKPTKIPGSPLRGKKTKPAKDPAALLMTPPKSPKPSAKPKATVPADPPVPSTASSFTLQITTSSKAELERVINALK